MKRIIFLNRFFYPDHSATSQILTDLAFHLDERGLDVHVVTSQQRYDQPDAKLPAEESVRGIHVHRVATTRFGRTALIGRGIDYASYYASTRRLLNRLIKEGDVIVAKTDPPLVGAIAMGIARHRQAHLINWLQDVYPEVAVALGVPLLKGPLAQAIARWRDQSMRAARANVVVGERMAERMAARGIDRSSIHVIPNWCDDDSITPVPVEDNSLRRDWGLLDKFVIGYSGNLGRAHECNTVVEAAERLKNDPRFIFLFVGGGHQLDLLAKRVRERQLDHMFRFMPYQARASLKQSLGVPDVHWLSLMPEVEGYLVPSKVYGIAAAGKPIIAVTAKDGEIARLVDRYDCGLVVEPGLAQKLADELLKMAGDARLIARWGEKARTMLDSHFTRKRAFERWDQLLETIA